MFKWNWEITWDEASIIIHVLLRYWHMAWNGRVQHHHAIALLHMVHVIHILHCMKYDVSMTNIVNCSGKTSIYFRQRKLMYVSGWIPQKHKKYNLNIFKGWFLLNGFFKESLCQCMLFHWITNRINYGHNLFHHKMSTIPSKPRIRVVVFSIKKCH